ncbi:MAG: hypothetical protein RLZZ584_572 [Pseudomonadota bacterium]
MLNWLFKRRGSTDARPQPTPAAAPAPTSARRSTAGAGNGGSTPAAASVAAAPVVDWAGRLHAAQGDDAALLRLAQDTTVLDIKLAAVQALAGEDALRQAERAFRSHDRKVHQLARKRLDAAVAQRSARAGAQALLERTATLLAQEDVAINHVVALDRAWQTLPADLLESDQRSRYAELRARLDIAMRERVELQQHIQRWATDARRAMAEARTQLVTTAGTGQADEVAIISQALQHLDTTRPDAPATVALAAELAQVLALAGQVRARLAWFDSVPALPAVPPVPAEPAAPAPPAADTPVPADRSTPPQPTDGTGSAAPAEPAEPARPVAAPVAEAEASPAAPRWRDLPAVPDAALARALEQRHERWLAARTPARRPAPAAAAAHPADAPPARPARAPKADPVLGTQQREQVEALVQQAQAALDNGRVSELQQQLAAIDSALGHTPPSALPDALRSSLQTLRAEGTRLRSWQQWGGSRAREELTDEAETLARQTQASADAEAADAPRLDIKTHREAIHALRLRWKELDRLGAPGNQALWQRFDAALQAASVPVAAHHAALAATRQANLAAREALLATLEALAVPDADAGADALAGVDWKALLRELGVFQAAWRKFGPVEHTVPAQARQAVQQRQRAAVERIEAPLNRARRAAVASREQLIAQAQALVPGTGRQQRPMGETTRLVRELQAAWQDHARQLPLARPVETELWTRFKAATDAVFAERDATFAARDAELAANLAACAALLERLEALGSGTPRAEVERTLAEVERAWRAGGELPRGALDGVERRYRAGHAAAAELLSSGERLRWQARCDTLAAALALCEEREAGNAAAAEPGARDPADELARRWSELGVLPAPWQQALAQRWARAPGGAGPLDAAAVDELLLQLEAALDAPTPPAWETERRQLKLRTLKEAMEGRRPDGVGGPARQAGWLQALLGQAGLAQPQRQRLQALLAALRSAAPGALGTPMAGGH